MWLALGKGERGSQAAKGCALEGFQTVGDFGGGRRRVRCPALPAASASSAPAQAVMDVSPKSGLVGTEGAVLVKGGEHGLGHRIVDEPWEIRLRVDVPLHAGNGQPRA